MTAFPAIVYECEDCDERATVVGHEIETALCPGCEEPMVWAEDRGYDFETGEFISATEVWRRRNHNRSPWKFDRE